MSYYNPDLPEFLDVLYLPDHEKIPGYLGVKVKFEEHVGWIKEARFSFQFLNNQVFFLTCPTEVQFPLGEAASLEEAIEIAKQFLKKWAGHDLRDSAFRIKTIEEIFRLEEEKRQERELKRRGKG